MKIPDSPNILCRRTGCDRPATHYPCVSVWAVGARSPRRRCEAIRIIPAIPLCRTHALERGWFTPDTQADFDAAIRATNPRLMPRDWDSAAFRPVSIADGDHPHTRTPTDLE